MNAVQQGLTAAEKALSRAAVTYAVVGASQRPDLIAFPPAGFVASESESRLGSGQARFDAAVQSLMTWGVHRNSGFTVIPVPADPPIQPGYQGVSFDAEGVPIAPAQITAQPVFAPDGSAFLIPGDTVIIRGSIMRKHVDAPVRALWTVDEPGRVGYGYGTLPGHPQSGETSLIVQHREDDSVWLQLREFHRAASVSGKLLPPLFRARHKALTARYLRALQPGRGV